MSRLILLPVTPQLILLIWQRGHAVLCDVVAVSELVFTLQQYRCADSFTEAY